MGKTLNIVSYQLLIDKALEKNRSTNLNIIFLYVM